MHDQLLENVSEYDPAPQPGETNLAADMLPFLIGGWLMDHITVSDKKYAPFLATRVADDRLQCQPKSGADAPCGRGRFCYEKLPVPIRSQSGQRSPGSFQRGIPSLPWQKPRIWASAQTLPSSSITRMPRQFAQVPQDLTSILTLNTFSVTRLCMAYSVLNRLAHT